jgi:hypothetical protein
VWRAKKVEVGGGGDCRELTNALFSTGICILDGSERFVGLTAVLLRFRAFGGVTLFQQVNGYFRFEGT